MQHARQSGKRKVSNESFIQSFPAFGINSSAFCRSSIVSKAIIIAVANEHILLIVIYREA